MSIQLWTKDDNQKHMKQGTQDNKERKPQYTCISQNPLSPLFPPVPQATLFKTKPPANSIYHSPAELYILYRNCIHTMTQKLALLLTGAVMAASVAGHPIKRDNAPAPAVTYSDVSIASAEPGVQIPERAEMPVPPVKPVEKGLMWGGFSACSIM